MTALQVLKLNLAPFSSGSPPLLFLQNTDFLCTFPTPLAALACYCWPRQRGPQLRTRGLPVNAFRAQRDTVEWMVEPWGSMGVVYFLCFCLFAMCRCEHSSVTLLVVSRLPYIMTMLAMIPLEPTFHFDLCADCDIWHTHNLKISICAYSSLPSPSHQTVHIPGMQSVR